MSATRTTAPTDADHLAGCVDGHAAALEVLYERHAGACLALARQILIDPDLAEDAVQEAFADLWRYPDRIDVRRSTVRSWMLMLTRRKAIDRVRCEQRRRNDVLTLDHDREDERPQPDVQAMTALLDQRVREVLSVLPEPKREALVLAYWGGYTQREIADLTSVPLGTIKSRTLSAMNELKVRLRSEAPDDHSAADPVRGGQGAGGGTVGAALRR